VEYYRQIVLIEAFFLSISVLPALYKRSSGNTLTY